MSERQAITLAPSVLTRYVGVYEFAPGQTFTVSVDSAQLAMQFTGAKPAPLLAESETRFFIRDLNLVVDFVRDGAGAVTEIVMLQGTRQERATRVK